jgi:hypothetical protein
MGSELGEMTIEQLAIELGFPEGSERLQKAKAELTYRQLKGQLEANVVQEKAVAVQQIAIGVQKQAAAAEAKAAEASIANAKAAEKAADASVQSAQAAERNAKYLLWSVFIAAISAIGSAVSAYFSYWSAVHPK